MLSIEIAARCVHDSKICPVSQTNDAVLEIRKVII